MDSERGDIITSFLVRLVTGLLVAGLLVIEAVALTVNRVGLDDALARAADAGAVAYLEHRHRDAVERAVTSELQRSGVELLDLELDADTVTVTGTRTAQVLASDEFATLDDLVAPERTSSAAAGGR